MDTPTALPNRGFSHPISCRLIPALWVSTLSLDAQVAHPELLPFPGPEHTGAPDHLPFSFHDYLELVDWAGRAVREDKRGAIPADIPAILTRLGIDPEAYLDRVVRRRQPFIRVIGRPDQLRNAAAQLGQRFLKGITPANALFTGGTG